MKTTALLTLFLLTCQTVVCVAQDSTTASSVKNKANPAGTWRLEYDWSGYQVKDAFRLKRGKDNQLLGTLYRNDTKLDIQDGKIEGDSISFTVTAEYEGTEWVTKYAGKIDGDALEGTAVVTGNGQSLELPWTPKRSVEMEDVVGSWQLHIEAPDGNTFDPILKITKEGDKYASQYGLGEGTGELDVQKLRVEDNELRFSLDTEYNGAPLKLDYRGRPYGDEINGTIAYDTEGNTGEFPFTAKRKPSAASGK